MTLTRSFGMRYMDYQHLTTTTIVVRTIIWETRTRNSGMLWMSHLTMNKDEDCLLAERHTGRGMEIWRAEDCYMLKKISSWRVHKFNTTSTDYLLKVTPQPEGLALLDQLSRVFVTLVSEITANMQGNDLVRFVLRSNSLDYPISLPFMPRLELNANRIMIEVERVLQSNGSVNIEDGMNINIHISMPLGGSPLVKRNIRNLF
ncbi:uncharacterized protein LOC125556692 isoform X2 [Nematostella vectensis]|uniref:uncharacterized protein LOC125556692 isoform X2 n=1 Tax=Nematostella vectensis TaxID=45351 RepID=UPI0020776E68|nr:uncharacterized protein LOC125556692 isoform X2 [Nematostella vectensis]